MTNITDLQNSHSSCLPAPAKALYIHYESNGGRVASWQIPLMNTPPYKLDTPFCSLGEKKKSRDRNCLRHTENSFSQSYTFWVITPLMCRTDLYSFTKQFNCNGLLCHFTFSHFNHVWMKTVQTLYHSAMIVSESTQKEKMRKIVIIYYSPQIKQFFGSQTVNDKFYWSISLATVWFV